MKGSPDDSMTGSQVTPPLCVVRAQFSTFFAAEVGFPLGKSACAALLNGR
jgi:hypothetical protein